MKQNFERNGNTLELTLVYDQAETKKAENKIVSNYAKSMNVPGFRKGKTPASVVRKMLTREQLDYNLADSLQVYRELDTFLDEHDETVLDVAITEMATKDGEYTVVAKIEYPEPMEIKNWEKLATKETKTIEDDAVEKFINNLYDVEDNYEFTDDEETEVAGHHAVTLRVTELDEEGNDVQESTTVNSYKLDGESPLETAVRLATDDKKVGEIVEFRNPDTNKQVKAEIIEVATLPELNLDEFATKQMYFQDCADGEALTAKVRDYLQSQLDAEANQKFFNELVQALRAENPYEVPAVLVEREMERSLRELVRQQFGMTGENADKMVQNIMANPEFRAQSEGAASDGAYFDLFVEQFGKEQNIELTEEEAQKVIDDYKNALPEGAKIDDRTIRFLKNGARHDKIVDALFDAQN